MSVIFILSKYCFKKDWNFTDSNYCLVFFFDYGDILCFLHSFLKKGTRLKVVYTYAFILFLLAWKKQPHKIYCYMLAVAQ